MLNSLKCRFITQVSSVVFILYEPTANTQLSLTSHFHSTALSVSANFSLYFFLELLLDKHYQWLFVYMFWFRFPKHSHTHARTKALTAL